MSVRNNSFTQPYSTRLLLEDEGEFLAYCEKEGVSAGVKIRYVVHEWLRFKRLQKLGRSHSENAAPEQHAAHEIDGAQQALINPAEVLNSLARSLQEIRLELTFQRSVLNKTFVYVWSTLDLYRRYIAEPFNRLGARTGAELEVVSEEELKDLEIQALNLLDQLESVARLTSHYEGDNLSDPAQV